MKNYLTLTGEVCGSSSGIGDVGRGGGMSPSGDNIIPPPPPPPWGWWGVGVVESNGGGRSVTS